jgi:hypothetical protein
MRGGNAAAALPPRGKLQRDVIDTAYAAERGAGVAVARQARIAHLYAGVVVGDGEGRERSAQAEPQAGGEYYFLQTSHLKITFNIVVKVKKPDIRLFEGCADE